MNLEQCRRDIREYEAASIIARLVGDAQVILNVGPSWGRDFFALQEMGKWVVNMDIAPQSHLPNTVQGDATRPFPFPAYLFDAVIMAEVLEHLIEDWVALREARRVLRDGGKLVITVPFYNDQPSYHVRIHSPKTILRLLAAIGFSAQQIIYRGGLVRVARLVHAIRKLLTPLGLDKAWYRIVVATDYWLGKQAWFQHFAEGVYILAGKGETLNWRQQNVQEFQH